MQRRNTGLYVSESSVFLSLVKVRCSPLSAPFKCVCCVVCRQEMKPGSAVHLKRGQVPLDCECQKPCESLLGFHLAGRCLIETVPPGLSWDLKSCCFSYWVEWEQRPVHVRTGTDSFHFHAIEKKKVPQNLFQAPLPSQLPFLFAFLLSDAQTDT